MHGAEENRIPTFATRIWVLACSQTGNGNELRNLFSLPFLECLLRIRSFYLHSLILSFFAYQLFCTNHIMAGTVKVSNIMIWRDWIRRYSNSEHAKKSIGVFNKYNLFSTLWNSNDRSTITLNVLQTFSFAEFIDVVWNIIKSITFCCKLFNRWKIFYIHNNHLFVLWYTRILRFDSVECGALR